MPSSYESTAKEVPYDPDLAKMARQVHDGLERIEVAVSSVASQTRPPPSPARTRGCAMADLEQPNELLQFGVDSRVPSVRRSRERWSVRGSTLAPAGSDADVDSRSAPPEMDRDGC